jgi:branched-chain amino acid transport system permease protein
VYNLFKNRQVSGAILIIISRVAYIVLVNLLAVCFGNETKFLVAGPVRTVSIDGAILTQVQIAQLVTSLVLVATYWMFLNRTALGRVCRSVADDPVLASTLGVRVDHTRSTVFGLGSFLAAVGAILMALDVGVDPQVGFPVVLLAAAACIIGGLHRFIATAIGGFLLGITQSFVVWHI